MLPLLIADSQDNLLPSLWAEWSQYGVRLQLLDKKSSSTGNVYSYIIITTQITGLTKLSVHPGSVLVPSVCYKVENGNPLHSSKRVLHLFVFLEQTCKVEKGNDQWAFLMDLTASVRANFFVFVSRYADRVSRAVHSALNKVLYNYSANAEVGIYM